MITEIAQIDVKPGSEKDFEAAVAKAKAAFGGSKGFHGFELHKSIEKAAALPADGEVGDAGEPHRRFPRLGEFHRMARPRRSVLCFAPGGRAHRDRADDLSDFTTPYAASLPEHDLSENRCALFRIMLPGAAPRTS